MTGEMHASEVTPEAFPAHFAIARAFGGEVKPFDQYQGPYVHVPGYGRVWVQTDDSQWLYVFSEYSQVKSGEFHWSCEPDAAVRAACEVLPAGASSNVEMG